MSKATNQILSPQNKHIKNQTFSFNPINNELITTPNNIIIDQQKGNQDSSRMPSIKQPSVSSNHNKNNSLQVQFQTPKQGQLNSLNNNQNFYIAQQYKTAGETALAAKSNSTQMSTHNQLYQTQGQLSTPQNANLSATTTFRKQNSGSQSQKLQNLNITGQSSANKQNQMSTTGIKFATNFSQTNTAQISPIKGTSQNQQLNTNNKKMHSAQPSATKLTIEPNKSSNIVQRKFSNSSISQNIGNISVQQRSLNSTSQQGFFNDNDNLGIFKDDNLIKQSQSMKDKRDKITTILQNQAIQEGGSLAELQKSTNLSLILSMFKCFQEELESKYILLPSTERTNLQRFVDIERIFFKHVKDIMQLFQKLEKQISDKDSNIQSLIQSLSVYQKTNEKFIDQINDYKIQENDVQFFRQKEKQFELNTIGLNIQNVKLQSEVESQKKKIEEIQSTIDVEALKKEIENLRKTIEDQTHQYKEITVNKEKQISVAQITVGSLKITNNKLEKEIAILREAYQKNTSSINTLCAENEELAEENTHYRERLFMLQEDIDGKSIRGQETKDLLKKFQTAYKKLQEKIDRITLEKSVNVDPPENAEFEDEVRFFETVRAVYKSNPLFTKRIKGEYYGLGYTAIDKKVKDADDKAKVFQNQIKVNANSSEPMFNINHYRFYKFSFFTFVQQKYDAILKNNQQVYKFRKVTNLFVGTLRAILDSKWNEAMTIDNYLNFSDFSDFTYSWLSTFCLDRQTRKIVYNLEFQENEDSGKETYLANFFIDLQNPILNKLWEVITFREFLSADTSSDEIYFYLHCRNMLFKGPQLEYMESTFQPIHFIRYPHAKNIIELVMCRYDQANIDFMVGTISRKCIKKNGNYLIDSGLVLRLLLEYYRAERIQRFRIIKELFFSQQGYEVNGQYTVSFDSFCKIFQNNYIGTTNLEKAQLYRDCITIGNGLVTSDIFYVVATERNFFMKHLRLKMLNELPEFDKTTLKLEPDYDYRSKMLTKFFEDCKLKLKGCLKYLKDYSMNQGLEQNYMKVTELVGYIQDLKNFNLESTTIQGKNIPMYFSQLIMKANQAAELQMYQSCQTGVNIGESEQMELLLNRFDSSLNFISDFIETKKNKIEIRRFVKLKKFQIWMRKKISKWYNVLNVLLLAKLSEAIKQDK